MKKVHKTIAPLSLTECFLNNKFNEIEKCSIDGYVFGKVLLSIFAKDIKANDFPSFFWRY